MGTVLLDWLEALPWKQQSIYFSGLRGPDVPNVPAVKAVGRWMRTVGQQNADPSKEYMRNDGLPDDLSLCEELEMLPCHFVHHFADALAVVAYGHPEEDVAMTAAVYHFRIAEELFHFVPERPSVFGLRHRDKASGADPYADAWGAVSGRLEHEYLSDVRSRFV